MLISYTCGRPGHQSWAVRGPGPPIFGHVLLSSQGGQDERPNPFTENHIRRKQKNAKNFLACLLRCHSTRSVGTITYKQARKLLAFLCFVMLKNALDLLPAGALPWTPLVELTTLLQPPPLLAGKGDTSSPFPISFDAFGVSFSAPNIEDGSTLLVAEF